MADRLDVAERLAEGRVAVEHTQAYVRACQTTGYRHPDLTSHPSQVRDWFDSEDGLDLRVLDRDCAQLRAAGAAAVEGLRIQHDQVAELSAAWTGAGSDAAVAFLQRHCDAANMVATEVRAAAQRCESLRDNLWYLLDSKVETAIAIDDRSQAQRSAWLTAAAVVTAGAGERSTAEQVVHGQITPYVDNDIRNDWLTAMRASLSAFGTAYDMVTDRMRSAPAVYFDAPGDLGPGFQPSPPPPPQPPPPPPVPAAAVTAPAAVLPGVAADPASAPTAFAPAAAPLPPAPPLSDPVSPLSDLGSGLGDVSALPTGAGGLGGGAGGLGGLSGLAGRIVDAMSGLLGSATDGLGDSSGLDDPLGKDPFDDDTSDEDPFHPDDEHDDADNKPDEADAEKVDGPKEADEAQPVDASPPAETPPLPVGEQPPASAPAPAATPAPAAAPAPPTEGSTPCEIAADQVPQAGQ
ncbi:hypothetical protein [Mycobacterium sp. Aquia_213]|uniref:hypothetical protein n=1 Tax=Mycobacterium sp. Aquia_213 TaxID=2991728 RepID=UPI00226DA137|nr:hypothetical protein [Mycobacterium sp. Aquia_213]WAC90688.1 hypothetical protein LMQ14_22735 [Mycobacterium sp. Aquia_213]